MRPAVDSSEPSESVKEAQEITLPFLNNDNNMASYDNIIQLLFFIRRNFQNRFS